VPLRKAAQEKRLGSKPGAVVDRVVGDLVWYSNQRGGGAAYSGNDPGTIDADLCVLGQGRGLKTPGPYPRWLRQKKGRRDQSMISA
jgi:hypothetical protein